MKKVLSIVLSIVMVLCMMPAMAFADTADFTDAADIEYTEAVDVLTAAGIINGMGDGTFGPNGNVTREQAAKLIATVLKGEKAEKLVASEAPFADVAADRWSAGYIAYCVEKGIVDGVGEGKFDPTGNVTALQLAKMLLTVAGYDAAVEGMTGAKWAANTSDLAAEVKLFAGNDAVLENQPASREEAALYILNALQTPMVGYTTKGTNVTLPDGTTIVSGASDAAPTGTTVMGKYVKDLALDTTTNSVDAFGRPANTWKYDDKEVGVYQTSEPVLTYTSAVKEKDLFAALGVTGTAVAANGSVAAHKEYSLTAVGNSADGSVTIANNGTGNVENTGEGVLVEIYKLTAADGTVSHKMVVVEELLDKVSVVTPADSTAGTKRSITLTNGTFETESFAKDDVVIITKTDAGVQSVELAEKVENVAVTAFSSTTVTFNGVAHKYSKNFIDDVTGDGYKMEDGNTFTFYLDSYGNVIKADEYAAAASTDYVMIHQIGEAMTESTALTNATYYNVEYVDMTGATKIVPVKSISGLKKETAWYTVKADTDNEGKYVFTAVTGNDKVATAKNITKIAASIPVYSTVKTNDSTVFVVKTAAKTATADAKWVTYTGISNVPTIEKDATNFTIYAVKGTDGYADAVYVDVSTAKASVTADEVYYVLKTDVETLYDATNKTYYQNIPVIGGSIKVKVGTENVAVGLLKITTKDTAGYITAVGAPSDEIYAKVNVAVASKEINYNAPTLEIPSVGNYNAANAKVYIIDANGNVTETDAAALDGTTSATAKISIVYASKDDQTVATIYFNGSVK